MCCNRLIAVTIFFCLGLSSWRGRWLFSKKRSTIWMTCWKANRGKSDTWLNRWGAHLWDSVKQTHCLHVLICAGFTHCLTKRLLIFSSRTLAWWFRKETVWSKSWRRKWLSWRLRWGLLIVFCKRENNWFLWNVEQRISGNREVRCKGKEN